MGLRTKFNLAIVAAFLVGFSGAAVLLQRLFVENARAQVLENARIMMSAADAIRHFTDVQIGPIAAAQNNVLNGRFIAASVPSFAAQTTFKAIQRATPTSPIGSRRSTRPISTIVRQIGKPIISTLSATARRRRS